MRSEGDGEIWENGVWFRCRKSGDARESMTLKSGNSALSPEEPVDQNRCNSWNRAQREMALVINRLTPCNSHPEISRSTTSRR
jgi:hypothetical protein